MPRPLQCCESILPNGPLHGGQRSSASALHVPKSHHGGPSLRTGSWGPGPSSRGPPLPRNQADAGWGPGSPFPPPALTTFWSLPQGLPPVQACLGPSQLCPSSPVGGWSTDVLASVRAWAGGWRCLGREGPVGWPAAAPLPPGPGPHTGAQGRVLTLRDSPVPGACPPRGQPWRPARSHSCRCVPAPRRPSTLGGVPWMWSPGWRCFRAPGGGPGFLQAVCRLARL